MELFDIFNGTHDFLLTVNKSAPRRVPLAEERVGRRRRLRAAVQERAVLQGPERPGGEGRVLRRGRVPAAAGARRAVRGCGTVVSEARLRVST